MKIGEIVLEKDNILGPAELALLATVGLQTVRVFGQPNVVIISTGNEVCSLFDDCLRRFGFQRLVSFDRRPIINQR